MRKTVSIVILIAFVITSVQSPAYSQSTLLGMMPRIPMPGTLVHLSSKFTPAYLTGIVIHPENGLRFDFIVYKGDEELSAEQKKITYTKLIKYFLASLAVPDEDQWVNLSPYEKDRIIRDDFGKTVMGRDLLAQDYMLKQITASLIYPEEKLGREFWDRVYSEAQRKYGTSNIPVNTFNKVWIVPDDALIYEKDNTAYVFKNHLKVMLEEDYLSMIKHQIQPPSRLPTSQLLNAKALQGNNPTTNELASKIVREIVLPELDREVNGARNFAPLRQVFSGMILAAWFKRALRESLLGKIYVNKTRLKGVDQNPQTNEYIYRQYLKAYKKGVFNYIKEEVATDLTGKEQVIFPRKYFSGGAEDSYNGIPGVMAPSLKIERILKPNDRAQMANQVLNSEVVEQQEVAPKRDLAMIAIELLGSLGQPPLSQIAAAFGAGSNTPEAVLQSMVERVQQISDEWKRNNTEGGYQGNASEQLPKVLEIVLNRYEGSDVYTRRKIMERILTVPASMAHLLFEYGFKPNPEKAVNDSITGRITDELEYRSLEALGTEGMALAEEIHKSPITRVWYHLWFLNEYTRQMANIYAKGQRDAEGHFIYNPVTEKERNAAREYFNNPKKFVMRYDVVLDAFKRFADNTANHHEALVSLVDEIRHNAELPEVTEASKKIGWSAFFDLGFSNPVRDMKTFSNFPYIDMAFFRGLGTVEITYDAFVPFDQSKRSGEEYTSNDLAAEELLAELLGITVTVHGPFLGHYLKGASTLARPIDYIEGAVSQVVSAQRGGKPSIVFHMTDFQFSSYEENLQNANQWANFVSKSYEALYDVSKSKLERGNYDPGIKIELENYFALDKNIDFPTAGEFIDHWEAIGNVLAQRAKRGDLNAKGALHYIFALLLDSAHYNLSNREDPFVSAYTIVHRVKAFGEQMSNAFAEFGQDYYKHLVGELHLNQNIGLISYFPGFSADIHSNAGVKGPIANQAIITLFYSLGYEPTVMLEQMQEFNDTDWKMARAGIEIGKQMYQSNWNTEYNDTFLKYERDGLLNNISFNSNELRDVYSVFLFIMKRTYSNNLRAKEALENHLLRREAQAVVGGFAFGPEKMRRTIAGTSYVPPEVVARNDMFFPKKEVKGRLNGKDVDLGVLPELFEIGQKVDPNNPFGAMFIIKAPAGQKIAAYILLKDGTIISRNNGDPLGERALLGNGEGEDGHRRSASVFLVPGASLMGFSEQTFKNLMDVMPDFKDLILSVNQRRLQEDAQRTMKASGTSTTDKSMTSKVKNRLVKLGSSLMVAGLFSAQHLNAQHGAVIKGIKKAAVVKAGGVDTDMSYATWEMDSKGAVRKLENYYKDGSFDRKSIDGLIGMINSWAKEIDWSVQLTKLDDGTLQLKVKMMDLSFGEIQYTRDTNGVAQGAKSSEIGTRKSLEETSKERKVTQEFKEKMDKIIKDQKINVKGEGSQYMWKVEFILTPAGWKIDNVEVVRPKPVLRNDVSQIPGVEPFRKIASEFLTRKEMDILAKGGIDFNAANLNLRIKRDGNGVPLPITRKDLENIKIDGLVPVIIDIKSATSLPIFAELRQS